MTNTRVGALFVGMNGATANTTIVGACSAGAAGSELGSVLTVVCPPGLGFPADQDIVFGGWDIGRENAWDTALRHGILPKEIFAGGKAQLENMVPMPGVVSGHDTSEARGSRYVRHASDLDSAVNDLKSDIARFKSENGLRTCVVVYLGSPLREPDNKVSGLTLAALTALRRDNSSDLSSSVAYAMAAIESGCGFVDFTPNRTLEIRGLVELATSHSVPIAGRDGSTGQTFLKTVLGEMFVVRNLRIKGWHSTNIIGNNDGLVLSRPEHRVTKMEDKLGALAPILGYSDFEHTVDITYYRPRGDNKEAWDNIDFLGWLGLPMSVKINWLGRDSILAAPLVLDLVKHMWYSLTNGWTGIQQHLAIYFKRPLGCGPLPFSQAVGLLRDAYIKKQPKEA